MRVLVTQWPNPSHLYAAIPMIWALQGAGHEVRVASHPDMAKAITAAGLTAVSLGTDETMPALSLENYAKFDLPQEDRDRFKEPLGLRPDEHETWEIFSTYCQIGLHILHPPGLPAEVPTPAADHLVEFAREWQPDLVLWEPAWASSSVAARLCGAAHARILWGLDYAGWAAEKFAERAGEVAAAGLKDPLLESIAPIAERYGLEVDDELLYGQWTVDPTPVEMRLPTSTRTVPVRRVPYTGIGVIPRWLHERPERPRVAVSLGASVRTHSVDQALISDILEMVGGLDIEVVATFNDDQLEGQTVPDNVRTIGYLPLSQLLPTCSAIIHHGGGGTLTAAVANEVPQLIVEGGGGLEAVAYSKYAVDNGACLTLNNEEQSVDEMRKRLMRVLEDPAFAEGTRRLHANWLALPSPNDIVPVLEKLTEQHKGRP